MCVPRQLGYETSGICGAARAPGCHPSSHGAGARPTWWPDRPRRAGRSRPVREKPLVVLSRGVHLGRLARVERPAGRSAFISYDRAVHARPFLRPAHTSGHHDLSERRVRPLCGRSSRAERPPYKGLTRVRVPASAPNSRGISRPATQRDHHSTGHCARSLDFAQQAIRGAFR